MVLQENNRISDFFVKGYKRSVNQVVLRKSGQSLREPVFTYFMSSAVGIVNLVQEAVLWN